MNNKYIHFFDIIAEEKLKLLIMIFFSVNL